MNGDDFCPRAEKQKQLAGYIQSGQNVVIYGERRIGKTSLIYETITNASKRRMLQARLGGEAPFSAAFLQGAGIATSASVTKTLNRLIKLKIIFKHETGYRFTNPFFKNWMLWKNM